MKTVAIYGPVPHLAKMRHPRAPHRRMARQGWAPRERQVLGMVCLGMTCPEIAEALNLSVRWIEDCVNILKRKAGVDSKMKLVLRQLERQAA